MTRLYRTPNGELTKDVNAAMKAWDDLTEPIAEALGAKVIGFDPGALFAYGRQTFDLPAEVLLKIRALILPIPKTFTEALPQVPSLVQRQDSLSDQCRDLALVAERMGMCDAAKFLRKNL